MGQYGPVTVSCHPVENVIEIFEAVIRPNFHSGAKLVCERDPVRFSGNTPRKPQTVNGYMVTLGTLIKFGGPICRINMPKSAFKEAMESLQHQKIVTKSESRTRRPSHDELDRLMEHFERRHREDRRTVPMHKIISAAIFEIHRQSAILAQTWVDYDRENEEITIRDIKHPRQTSFTDWDHGSQLMRLNGRR
jgi:hypothetical protein